MANQSPFLSCLHKQTLKGVWSDTVVAVAQQQHEQLQCGCPRCPPPPKNWWCISDVLISKGGQTPNCNASLLGYG